MHEVIASIFLFLSLSAAEVDPESFISQSVGEYEALLETDKDGQRKALVLLEEQKMVRRETGETVTGMDIYLEVDEKPIVRRWFEIPRASVGGRLMVKLLDQEYNYTQPHASDDFEIFPFLFFVTIEGRQYFPYKLVFQKVKEDFQLKKLFLLETGFVPPPFKRKYILEFTRK